jgi:hypothetical protein
LQALKFGGFVQFVHFWQKSSENADFGFLAIFQKMAFSELFSIKSCSPVVDK